MTDLPKDYFRVEIVHVQHRPTVERAWQRMSDKGNATDGGATYGYAEEPSVKREERQVLKMETEYINVPSVVRAVLSSTPAHATVDAD